MNFQAQIWSSLFVVFSLFIVSKLNANPREFDSSLTITNLLQGKQNEAVSVLQKHVMFFDLNNDGIIYPSETFKCRKGTTADAFRLRTGFRTVGFGITISTAAGVTIHLGFSSKTRPGEPFDPTFPIMVKNIRMAKHTSDSGVYDTNGGFVESEFEKIFQKHANTTPNALTSNELNAFMKSNRVPKDYTGWIAGILEWELLYILGKDEKGLLQKETVRAVYDGSLFEQMAKEKSPIASA